MKFARSSGILLHPTSLPGRFAIGDLGPEAYRFVDFLAGAGQAFWQVMPLGPPGAGHSPYSSTSAFAGNVTLIGPESLVEDGWLAEADIRGAPERPRQRVNYARAIECKQDLIEAAFRTFTGQNDPTRQRDYAEFRQRASGWLEDYALFAALADEHAGAPWPTWESGLVKRAPDALARARHRLRARIERHCFAQYLFFRQWHGLKRHANEKGIRVIGDMPIFVAHNSADVWARPHLFKLRADGQPAVVAGVPPDAFSATGQLWGNPVYAWERMREDGFAWWCDRVRHTLGLVDVVRVDHFRGFAACWEVAADAATAEHGRWVEAPGRDLFREVMKALGTEDLPIIAEDLGTITADVHRLRDELGFPGMRVLQFAFSGDPHDTHLPHEYPSAAVAYTGTHDNDTVVGWFRSRSRAAAGEAERRERANCLRYLGTNGSEINWSFIRAVHMSVADIAVAPLQDLLGLGSSARMNTPGVALGNWRWRFREGALTAELRRRMREMTAIYGRLTRD